MDKRTQTYIYHMSWFESPRHRRSHTDMYFAEPQHTLWGFDNPLCRISYIKVPTDSVYFRTAKHKRKEGRQTKNIWLAYKKSKERTIENNKNTLNAPCRKYVKTI